MWEETIILLPDNVHYVFLSATIHNARQFAEWICHLHKQVGRDAPPMCSCGCLAMHDVIYVHMISVDGQCKLWPNKECKIDMLIRKFL